MAIHRGMARGPKARRNEKSRARGNPGTKAVTVEAESALDRGRTGAGTDRPRGARIPVRVPPTYAHQDNSPELANPLHRHAVRCRSARRPRRGPTRAQSAIRNDSDGMARQRLHLDYRTTAVCLVG